MKNQTTNGLDGTVVAQTRLSKVDGQAGRLIVGGVDIGDLAGQVSFEQIAARLWDEDPAEAARAIGAARLTAARMLPEVLPAMRGLSPIAALRLGLTALPDAENAHHLATGAIPVFLAAHQRGEPVAPDPDLGHAADFLRMRSGNAVAARLCEALDAYLVTVAEHGMNASTFTARVIASTRAGMLPAVIGALCALEGPLHGGAPGPVLDMLDEIGAPERIDAWLAGELAAGRRLMGFGHRVYRVRDPRADVLAQVVARLDDGDNARLRLAAQVERAALAALEAHKPDRPLFTNVEFYTALLLEAVGLDRTLFTPVFGMARVAGWTAHVIEQRATGRLMRPKAAYVGLIPASA